MPRAYQILENVQQKRVHLIVQREPAFLEVLPWREADLVYEEQIDEKQLGQLATQIGLPSKVSHMGTFLLLEPVVPASYIHFGFSEEKRAWLMTELQQRRQQIEQIQDDERKKFLLSEFDKGQKKVALGLPSPQDKKVLYNPLPHELFAHVSQEIWRTLQALFSGSISFKYVSGPIGIVQVVQSTSKTSLKEAFFWIGVISLNLGILNLLPIPILDGGTIVFSFFELFTGKRIKPKVLERIVIVFGIVLIAFFLFLTYNDIVRFFG